MGALSSSPGLAVSLPREQRVAPYPDADAEITRLYREHGRRVARWVGRLAGPGLEVEDLVQEVFMIAHRRLHTVRGDARIETWLYGIAENVVRHRRRRERVRKVFFALVGREVATPASRPSPAEEAERAEAASVAYELLEGLRESYRNVFILYEIEGLSWPEIAALTGEKEGTLRVRLHRAREEFFSRLAKRSDEVRALVEAREGRA
jgi:RNA polymerase sigma-70 factor (ECF subfamily)